MDFTTFHRDAIISYFLATAALNAVKNLANVVSFFSLFANYERPTRTIYVHCTAVHCTVVHCKAVHCTAVHCTAVHCTQYTVQ